LLGDHDLPERRANPRASRCLPVGGWQLRDVQPSSARQRPNPSVASAKSPSATNRSSICAAICIASFVDLTALPDFSTINVHTLFSEVGGDLSQFPHRKTFLLVARTLPRLAHHRRRSPRRTPAP